MVNRLGLFLLCGVMFAFAPLCGQSEEAAVDLKGAWKGRLLGRLDLILHIKAEGERLVATLDSPNEGSFGIPVGLVTQQGQEVRFEAKVMRASYRGALSADGQTIAGQWNQLKDYPLDFVRVDPESVLPPRPQTPKPPFPYRAEEVRVSHEDDTGPVQLAGTLTLPPGEGPFAAAILITGSGQQNRDEEIMAHRPFLVIADHLTRSGLAVLRMDDRGVGGSTGEVLKATSAHFANDIRAACQFLRARKDIAPDRIGLIGHSEGGLIAALVGAQDPNLGFIVSLAGPGVPGSDILVEQLSSILGAMGATKTMLEPRLAAARELFAAMKQEAATEEEWKVGFEAAMKKVYDALLPLERMAHPNFESFLQSESRSLGSPWFRYFVKEDPAPHWRKVKAPVLAMNGSKDIQVSADQNLGPIAAAVRAGGNERVKTERFEGLNHLFQTANRGTVQEYGRIQETFAPKALEEMTQWILEVIGAAKEAK